MINSYYEGTTIHLLLLGEIEQESMDTLAQRIFDLEADKEVTDIYIHINSTGGSVVDGFSLIGAITNSTKKIVTINDGVCLSMGAIIFIAGHERIMKDYSILMLHNPSIWGLTEEEFEQGSSAQKSLSKIKESLINIVETRTKMTKIQATKYFNEESWLNASECLELGICDTVQKTAKKPKVTTENLSEFILACKNLMLIPRVPTKNNIHFKINNKKTSIQMKEVTNLLGLPSDASETQIHQAISKIKDKLTLFEQKNTENDTKIETLDKAVSEKSVEIETLKGVVSDKTKEVTEISERLKTYENKFAENLVENAIKEGKISKEAKEKMITLAVKDIEQFNTLLASIPERPKMKDISDTIDSSANKSATASWSYLDWSQKDPKGLQELKKADPEKFNKLLDEYITKKNK